jgi:hypothetical protein
MLRAMSDGLDDPHAYFFHVRIFLGMIVSLALAQFVRALVKVVQHPGENHRYWVHLVWVASTFIFLVHFWWWELRFAQYADWTFHVYLFLISYALLLYFLAALLLPDDLGAHSGYRDYFYARRRWFFGVLALVYVIDFADTWLKGPVFFESLGTEYVVRNFVYIIGSVAAIATRNAAYHAAFAVVAIAYQVAWIARMYERLN